MEDEIRGSGGLGEGSAEPSAAGRVGGYDWDAAPDLTAISEEELRGRLKVLAEEEREVSFRRRVLQGRIDLIRAELVRRGGATLSPEELARVLLGGEKRRDRDDDAGAGGVS